MDNKVLSFNKRGHFPIFLGAAEASGEMKFEEQVGIAFPRSGAFGFRIKLWMFPGEQLFLSSTEDGKSYRVISMDERKGESVEAKTFWNEVGSGELVGSHIKIKFHLLARELYIALFPKNPKEEVIREAV